jgi:hypothetical protein
VCVHPDHLCDGTPQCPRHDDECCAGRGHAQRNVSVTDCLRVC